MEDERKLRQMDINQSMTKPLLVLGCDRRLLLTSSLGCVYVGFNLGLTQGNFGVAVLAVVMWIAIRFGLKQMGKNDPLMLDVFQRSMRYSNGFGRSSYFYPACSTIDNKMSQYVKKRWS